MRHIELDFEEISKALHRSGAVGPEEKISSIATEEVVVYRHEKTHEILDPHYDEHEGMLYRSRISGLDYAGNLVVVKKETVFKVNIR